MKCYTCNSDHARGGPCQGRESEEDKESRKLDEGERRAEKENWKPVMEQKNEQSTSKSNTEELIDPQNEQSTSTSNAEKVDEGWNPAPVFEPQEDRSVTAEKMETSTYTQLKEDLKLSESEPEPDLVIEYQQKIMDKYNKATTTQIQPTKEAKNKKRKV